MALSETAVTPSQVTATSGVANSTTSFSPGAGSMVVVAVSWLFASNVAATLTVQDSLGNSYTAGPQVQDNFDVGIAAVFTRQYATAPGSITIKVTCSNTGSAAAVISPRILTGQAASQAGAATVQTNNGSTNTTAIQESITTTTAGSLVYMAAILPGNTTLTAISGTTTISNWSNGSVGDTGGTAKTTSVTGTPGATTIGWTSSVADNFGFVALEILPGSSTSAITQTDTAAAKDATAVSAAAPQGDTAAASDALAVTGVGQPLADTAAASDALTAGSVTAPLADTAAAKDTLPVSAAAPMGDTAAASESVLISIPATVTDTAAAKDSLSVTVAAPMSDTAGAGDAAANLTPQPVDTAAASDKLAEAVTAPMADTAAAGDSIAPHVFVTPGDTAAASESLSYIVGLALTDTAAAKDNMGVVGPGSGPTGFGSVLPSSILNAYTGPGYQGGPSGAGSQPPSALGNGWEIEVRSSSDYTTLLAVIPGSMLLNWQFARMLNDIGSGTVVLNQDDPWWSQVTLPGGLASETLLDEECLWQVWKDGVCRFEFFGETVTEQLVDGSEQRQATVTGPGTLTSLKWAMVAPPGFPDIVLKLDGLLDAFDEVDNSGNPVLDTNIWTTATPASDVYITPISVIYNYPTGAGYALSTLYPSGSLTLSATPGTTYLGASPYDATDTLISAQVTPIGVSSSSTDTTTPAAYGTGLDGSELTQFYIQSNFNSQNYAMIGLSGSAFYAQLGSGGQVQTQILPAYDSQNHAYWMITEQAGSGGTSGTFYFWTSPDGQQWTQQWTVVHHWDATNVTFFVTATYSTAGKETVQLSNLNSNVTTPSYQGSIYLGLPMMGIWFDQFAKAQKRGTIPFVTTTATPTADSYGRAWSDNENVQAVNGTDLYSFLQGATSVVDADYVMDPGFQLRIGIPAAGQVAVGVDRSNYLIFRDGYDVMARQRVRARDSIATLIGGENSDGHEISADSPAFISEWGQREAWFQTAAQVDPTSMAYATAASLAQNETEVVSWSFSLRPNVPGKTVFDNFDVGDWVGLERPDFSAVDKVRVVGIAVQVDNSGAETHELTFQSYIQWLAEQLLYLANKLGGSFVNTLGTTPVAPSKYGTGQVPTYFTPAATLSGLADVSSSAGSAQGTAPLVYNPATGQYQHAGTTDPVTGQTIPVTVTTPAGSATLSDTQVVVNTGNGSTTVGLQGDGTVATVATGGSAPSVPDVPSVASIVQGLSVGWDGLLSGASPLSSFSHVTVHVGTTSGFTPSTANQAGTLSQAGAMPVGNLTAGSTYYVKLVAWTNAGVPSAATTAVTGVPGSVPTSLLTGQLPASLLGNSAGSALNPNPYFNGADLTGWFVTNGSVAALAPPSGAPGGAQYAARVTSTAANCLLSGSPDPFPVTPGQPYAMTAWVYNPGGSAVNVAVGFNWTGGTTTVSVGPGAWVPLTTVQTCPAGVTSAYQVIGPTASGVTVWVLGAVAAGQVPGQLIAAQSVAAQQIAANTITAAQIAANTITASQIAANTITAAQIAASTITAAQIAASTITATQIAAGTITASQIAAGTVIAGVVNGTTISAATFLGTNWLENASGQFFYSGTPASGNLMISFAPSATADPYSNSAPAGITLYGSNGSMVQISDNGTAAAIAFPSGVAGETVAAAMSMDSLSGIEMRITGPQSGAGGITIVLNDQPIGYLEAGGGTSATWSNALFSVVHQLYVGVGATGGATVEVAGGGHFGGALQVDGAMTIGSISGLNGNSLPMSTVSNPSLTSPSSNETQLASAINGLISRLRSAGFIS